MVGAGILPAAGFGSRMIDALVQQLGGKLEFSDNQPGTRAVLSAPIDIVQRSTGSPVR